MDKCLLNVAPFYQCCCKCIYHIPDYKHCGIDGRESGCVCDQIKGWICMPGETNRAVSNWYEHSCGCEMYLTKETYDKLSAPRRNLMHRYYLWSDVVFYLKCLQTHIKKRSGKNVLWAFRHICKSIKKMFAEWKKEIT